MPKPVGIEQHVGEGHVRLLLGLQVARFAPTRLGYLAVVGRDVGFARAPSKVISLSRTKSLPPPNTNAIGS